PEHTATALIPLVFTKSSDNSEAALLALRLLYEQGHGELLQTAANRWQRTDVWPAPVWQNWCWQCGLQQAGEQLLKTVLTR
ncbi:hypothetical protein OFB92_35040, partial [Escherichia coli]|nr:hypothetical protein [Escherichia coli]